MLRDRGGIALWNFTFLRGERALPLGILPLALWSVTFSVGGALRFGTLLLCVVEGALCFETLPFSVQRCTYGLEPYFYAIEGSVGFRASLALV